MRTWPEDVAEVFGRHGECFFVLFAGLIDFLPLPITLPFEIFRN